MVSLAQNPETLRTEERTRQHWIFLALSYTNLFLPESKLQLSATPRRELTCPHWNFPLKWNERAIQCISFP